MSTENTDNLVDLPVLFNGRALVIATNHGKEQVIAPLLENHLGVQCTVAESLNTDQFGTFSGEIKRNDDALTTARDKCHAALELTGLDLAVASEGSFGPHPTLFFVPANEELLLFVDLKNNLEIAVRSISTSTNYASAIIKSVPALLEFANTVQFPSHGIILSTTEEAYESIEKGITDPKRLLATFEQLVKVNGSVFAQTDMRAHVNPSRMEVIAETTDKLCKRIVSTCPQCKTPGFGITDAIKGLPCEVCLTPTESTLHTVSSCSTCNLIQKDFFPHTKQHESATYCNKCNP